VSPVRACVIPGRRDEPGWWFSRTGEHIGVVSFAVQRIADSGLVDPFTAAFP